jgi:hypothetical protein
LIIDLYMFHIYVFFPSGLMRLYILLDWKQSVKVCKNHCSTMTTTWLGQLFYLKSWLPMDARR